MGYMLFSGFVTDEGLPIIPADTVAKCYGIEDYDPEKPDHIIRHILRIYRRDVDGLFEWREARETKGGWKAREVSEWGLDAGLRVRLERELRTKVSALEDPVNWQTGRQIDPKFITNEYQRLMDKATVAAVRDRTADESARWMRYMNARSARGFRVQVEPRLDEGWKIARSIDCKDPQKQRQKRLQAAYHMREIGKLPKPIYESLQNSVRLKAPKSLQTVQSDIRKVLTKGWTEFDLASAQLAIAAKKWGLNRIYDFLDSGRSIWESIAEESGLPMEYKPVFKKALYSYAYGAGRQQTLHTYMKERADEKNLSYAPEKEGRAILSHWAFPTLKEARDKRLKKIEAEGGAYDCFDRWMSMEDPTRKKRRWQRSRSILAAQNQAIEMDLLSPALDLAEKQDERKRSDWQIMLFQHDGFSVRFRRYADRYTEEITQAVNAKCERLGYPTRLESERL
jgi:hypothetical protein